MKKTINLIVCMLFAAFCFLSFSVQAQLEWSGTIILQDGDNITQNITLTGNVNINVSNSGQPVGYNSTANISGVISGSYNLTKTGGGKLTLAGVNTYSGITNINDGTLALDTTGSIENSSKVQLTGGGFNISGFFADYSTSNKTIKGLEGSGGVNLGSNMLTINNGDDFIFSGSIAGASISKTGTGRLTLNGSNSHYQTYINDGTLVLGSAGSISNSVVILMSNTAKFDISTSNKTIRGLETNGNYPNAEVILGNRVLTINITSAGSVPIDLIFSGKIIGTGGITITGTGSLAGPGKLTLTQENTYTGVTTISSGTLQLGNNTSAGSIAGNIVNDANLIFFRSDDYTYSKIISGTGGVTKTGTGILYLTGNNTYTGTTTISNGTLQLGNNTPTGSVAGNIFNNANLVFARSDDYTNPLLQSISGSGSITKIGTSILTLRGINYYTGTTNINDGTLALASTSTIDFSVVSLMSNTAKFNISTGNKTIRGLESNSNYPNAEVILGNRILTINNTSDFTFHGKFTGMGGSITKRGVGMFAISNSANTATGTFIDTVGIVLLDNANWAGNFRKYANGNLEIIGNVNIGGTLTLSGGNTMMNLTTTPPSKITVTGAVTASGTNTLTITTTELQINYVLIQAASGITSIAPYTLAPISGFPGSSLNINTPTQLRLNASAAPPVLGGTVTITGNAVFGQTLIANTTGLTSNPQGELGTLSYQWKRGGSNISGATSSTYTLVQADITNTITVTVTAANCQGEVTSNPTTAVQKATQTAPAAPTKLLQTSTSITLNTVSGCEYSINNGSSYQTSPQFTGLIPNTSYTFVQRMAGTPTLQPSPASNPASFSTDKATLSGTPTITGSAVFGEILTAVTTGVTSVPVVTLGTLSYQWKRGGNNISGATNATYTLVQADITNTITVTVTAANCTGEVTSNPTAAVQKAPQTAPTAPTKLSQTSTSITLNTVSGYEYNINGGTYQSSTLFGGLSPSTTYSFTQRKAETATHLASQASTAANFSTDAGTPPVLGGTVTISGSAVFGEMLTSNTSGLTCTPSGPLGTLSYVWKRTGTTATGTNTPTHTLVQEDIGCTISVTVTAVNCTGSVTSNSSATVQKATQTAPATPTLADKTTTSITLATVFGCEYNINGGTYLNSPVFTGLSPNTAYNFTQRKAETATHLASPASTAAQFKTDDEVGIDENLFAGINIFPNPTTGELRITNYLLRIESIEIFDVIGKKVFSNHHVTPSSNHLINISHLQGGLYFVKIQTEAGEMVKKIVKQ